MTPQIRPHVTAQEAIADRVRLLVVVQSLDIGGTEKHLLWVLPRLIDRGFDVTVFAAFRGGDLVPAFADAGVPVVVAARAVESRRSSFAQAWHWFRTLLRLMRTISRERPDIVHCFLTGAYVLGVPAAVLAGARNRVVSRRNLNGYQTKRPGLYAVERRLHRYVSLFLGNSHAVAQQLTEEGIDPDRVRVLPNGISIPAGRAAVSSTTRTDLGLTAHQVVMIIVANLSPYKGHLDLLDAVAKLTAANVPDWQLLCVGKDYGVQGDLVTQVEKLGIASHVRFLGSRDDVPDLLGAADIGVAPSHEEGFSNAILEGHGGVTADGRHRRWRQLRGSH